MKARVEGGGLVSMTWEGHGTPSNSRKAVQLVPKHCLHNLR